MHPSLTCSRHIVAQTPASSLMCASSGDCVRICAPAARTFLIALATAGVCISTWWLKCDMMARCSPASAISPNMESSSSASGSVSTLYGQYASILVPILMVRRCGMRASIRALTYRPNMPAFIIIGSPPVNSTSDISGCSCTYWTSCSPSRIANFMSSMPTNCGHLKQKLQYAWHVWLWLGKNRHVSLYLCCIPYSFVPSLSDGTFSSSWPAGWGLSCRRISLAVSAISLRSAPARSLPAICSKCLGLSMLRCGNVRTYIGSFGTLSQSMSCSTT